ncbi:MAG: tRNA uridine-5-carboxymethylaminomethyl(34) synthesis GTPase MnmE, partial [Rhodothermales bacterium]|nr:tRNA uridine-5-carboxymethylaminomethyl(34) synthesis GTPase MnmE [Rhodothermales bacterium]
MSHGGDTIAAIATARGRAALAIVRLSGADAVNIASRCFQGKDLTDVDPETVHFGRFRSHDGGEIDQVVATVFRAPRSATGEDLVEISCHGGDFAPVLILKSLLAEGARMAQPGEYTQRAFLNGKMDLTQAEAVADLIHASSTLAHRTAVNQLEGRYSDLLAELRSELLEVSALVELELDFSEEDVEFADRERLADLLSRVRKTSDELLASYRLGALIRDGVRVVIAGRPNAGKSTLLNALLGRDRAIVSDIPGTTRDEIEAEMEIGGVNFRFVDTAGLREAADLIEAEGVERARRSISSSDVLVYVVDLVEGLQPDEIDFIHREIRSAPGLPVVVVGNKADLVEHTDLDLPEDLESLPTVAVCAKRGVSVSAETAPLVAALLA